jgi:hypothetical protein
MSVHRDLVRACRRSNRTISSKVVQLALTPAKTLSRIADHYTARRDVFSDDTPRLYNYRYPLRADSPSLDMR